MLSSEGAWAVSQRLQSVAVEEKAQRIIPSLTTAEHEELIESIDIHLAFVVAAVEVLQKR